MGALRKPRTAAGVDEVGDFTSLSHSHFTPLPDYSLTCFLGSLLKDGTGAIES